jgi:nitroreductase
MRLQLSPDELLSTTRAVRRRLDFDRPVEREVLLECLELALQAPSGGNSQPWSWVLVEEPGAKQAIGDLYRKFFSVYLANAQNTYPAGDPRSVGWDSLVGSGEYLAEHIHRAPWLVIPCVESPLGRADTGTGAFAQAMFWGSVYPAVWSFMLALRERGLASCLTTNHLAYEREVAELLGIPYDRVNQAGLLPVAYSKGTEFRRAARLPVASVVHIGQWQGR